MERSKSEVKKFYDGEHNCQIYTQDVPSDGTRAYLILLSIRLRRNDAGADATLPQHGERVYVHFKYNGHDQDMTGHVVEIPEGFRGFGYNVAVKVQARPGVPNTGRIMVQSTTHKADFQFGHSGQNFAPVVSRIKELMTGNLTGSSDFSPDFLNEVLLAHDIWATLTEAKNGNKNRDYASMAAKYNSKASMLQHIDAVCRKVGLSKEQIDVVRHFFTHRLTLVRGPGGTGK